MPLDLPVVLQLLDDREVWIYMWRALNSTFQIRLLSEGLGQISDYYEAHGDGILLR